MDAKRQLETQTGLLQKTRDQLSAAQLEMSSLRLQQGSEEGGRPSLGSQSSPSIPMGLKGKSTHNVTESHQPQCLLRPQNVQEPLIKVFIV